ncbi:MAG: hypothetical protein GF383_07880 [Candidatus Lokiarchaeota archaeon]|nr:hypothetical protein [Candidatus Lokiarchaeota archaeon]MBD3340235.1 hypothetical protein [Candidatus Lokiarchaeota archaeon]
MTDSVSSGEDAFNALLDLGYSEREISEMVKSKSMEFQGFMSKEAILLMVAKKCGIAVGEAGREEGLSVEFEQNDEIDYDELTISIERLDENMSNLVLLGRVQSVFPIREFARKDGSRGVVGSFLINDGTGSTKIVLWDQQTDVMRSEFFEEGQIVQVIGAYSKLGRNDLVEVHLAKTGKIVLDPKNVDFSRFPLLKISKLNIDNIKKSNGYIPELEGVVAEIDQLKEFTKKTGEKSFLLHFVLRDSSGLISVLVWGMEAIKCLKKIDIGKAIRLENPYLKRNQKTGIKELHLTPRSKHFP